MTDPTLSHEAIPARELTRALSALIGDAHVTGRRALDAMGVEPANADADVWLLRPGSAAELAGIVAIAARENIAIVPIGNATRIRQATRTDDRRCMFVEIRRMNHVLNLDETSLVVHVQAGLTASALEEILAPRGLSIGDYPPATLKPTIGGLLSVRTPGKSSPRHGFIEDAVLGVSAVLADGRTIHTRVAPRRSTGPDLARVLCGSEGTLGIITSAVLRIHRHPETRYLAAYVLPDMPAAFAAVRLALREEAALAAMRVYDNADAREHLGDAFDCDTGAGGLGPSDVGDTRAVLVVATAGPTDLAACDRGLVQSAVEAMNGAVIDTKAAQTWWKRRTGQEQPAADVPRPHVQLTASPKHQVEVYQAVIDAAVAAGGNASVHASRFDADGAVLFVTLRDKNGRALESAETAPHAEWSVLRDQVREAARAANAYLLGTTNVALDPYFAGLRAAMDPKGIMNPGAFAATQPE